MDFLLGALCGSICFSVWIGQSKQAILFPNCALTQHFW